MKGKKLLLKTEYWLRRIQINAFKYVLSLLFLVSIILSLLILIPNLFTHHLYMIGIEGPRILQIDGVIVVQKAESAPGIGATIEIGGYRTVADQDGKFSLKFLSKSYEDIPVIIKIPNKCPIIKRISFKWDEYKKMEAIAIDDK